MAVPGSGPALRQRLVWARLSAGLPRKTVPGRCLFPRDTGSLRQVRSMRGDATPHSFDNTLIFVAFALHASTGFASTQSEYSGEQVPGWRQPGQFSYPIPLAISTLPTGKSLISRNPAASSGQVSVSGLSTDDLGDARLGFHPPELRREVTRPCSSTAAKRALALNRARSSALMLC